jgi:hypothetical protein
MFGDILFTIFALLWMTWPLGFAFYYNYLFLWISSLGFSSSLIVKGYMIIKNLNKN